MATTMEQVRAWKGPALFSFGFRPFFLGAAIWAALSMILWIAMLGGIIDLPTLFDPVSWHAHEFLFGYLGAVAAGFLLTAVPNWTGRLPVVGWPLAALSAFWLAGRIFVATSVYSGALVTAAIDLAFPTALAFVIGREIFLGRNWRNLIVLAMLGAILGANALFHWEAANDVFAAEGYGLRLGLAAGIMMIVVIGGRIVPSFTRNWLVKSGSPARPASIGRYDAITLLATLASLAIWVALPLSQISAMLLLASGALNFYRLSRWAGHCTFAEPLVWILHVGYLFVPFGAIVIGLSVLLPGALTVAAAQHLWMAGAVGTMTLAVMSRATLGHTGQDLKADAGISTIYLAVILAVLTRIIAGALPDYANVLHTLSGLAWITGFAGFVLRFGPSLLKPRARN